MISLTTIIIYSLAGLSLIFLIWIIRLEIRLRKFIRGKNAQSLEDIIKDSLDMIAELDIFKRDMQNYAKTVEHRLNQSIRGVHTLRFDAFEGTGSGGKQSFSTAFLNAQGDGVIISGLYARDRISVFAKPVEHFTSIHELSLEEKDALTNAQKSCKL